MMGFSKVFLSVILNAVIQNRFYFCDEIDAVFHKNKGIKKRNNLLSC